MSIESLHPWTYDVSEAIRVQEGLRNHLVLAWDDRPVRTIGGVDTSFRGNSVYAAIVVFSYPDLAPSITAQAQAPLLFPYVSGLLAFSVGPAILAAWENLDQKPDLAMFHGQGTAHPRGVGLASHMGIWLNLPTIGVAKSRLYGNTVEPGSHVGDWSELRDEHQPKQIIGAVLRTQPDTQPVYVSPGHLIDIPHAMKFVLDSCGDYRQPEPIRIAHMVAVHAHSVV